MKIRDLENWHADKCNGDWEHQGGIRIETLDNPGWRVHIEFDTYQSKADGKISSRNKYISEDDFVFYEFNPQQNSVTASCDQKKLTEVLEFLTSL